MRSLPPDPAPGASGDASRSRLAGGSGLLPSAENMRVQLARSPPSPNTALKLRDARVRLTHAVRAGGHVVPFAASGQDATAARDRLRSALQRVALSPRASDERAGPKHGAGAQPRTRREDPTGGLRERRSLAAGAEGGTDWFFERDATPREERDATPREGGRGRGRGRGRAAGVGQRRETPANPVPTLLVGTVLVCVSPCVAREGCSLQSLALGLLPVGARVRALESCAGLQGVSCARDVPVACLLRPPPRPPPSPPAT